MKQKESRGWIDPSWQSFQDFEDDLNYAIAHPDAPPRGPDYALTPFGELTGTRLYWKRIGSAGGMRESL